MSERTTATTRFSVQGFTYRPVAKITPAEATNILGSSVVLSAAASTINGEYSTDFEFEWSLSAPDGSLLEEVTFEDPDDQSQVLLSGDVTGTYVVTLTVTYDGVSSEPVQAGVFFSPVIVPSVKRLEPDGTFMFSVLSNFWKLVNDREAFPVIWSSYTQTVASDLLRALQIDRSKSIRTIQPLFQKRFINISPEMEIDSTQVDMLLGNHQSGDGAFTGQVSFVGSGTIISAKEFLLLNAANEQAVGTYLEIYTGDNAGKYLINRINSAGNGFIVSESSPFPSASSLELAAGSDLVGTGGSTVYSVLTNFSSASTKVGDVLHIKEGSYAGYYSITAVGTADGLSSDRHLSIDGVIGITSGMKFRVLQKIRATYLQQEEALTDVVYIPKDQADFTSYEQDALSSTAGELVSDYEIIVSPSHLIDSAIDKQIKITTGTIGGTSFTISGFNSSRTGFIVTAPFSVASYPETVSYSIDVSSSASDRLLIINGQGHDISNVSLLENLPTEEEGGRGDLWAVTLASKTAPSRLEGANWRICSTITYTAIDNFEDYGVSEGDLLKLQIYRTDLQKASFLLCTIVGVRGNQISFELGTSPISSGTVGTIDPENALSISSDLSIPTVTLSEVSGDPLYTSSALDIFSFVNGASFSSSYFGYPLDAETLIDIDGFFSINIIPHSIIRNSRVGLDPEDERPDEPIFSIPSLSEYLTPETTFEDEDTGEITIVSKDGSVKVLDRAPVRLVENINYQVSDDKVRGSGATTAANSATLIFTDLNTVAAGISVGDQIELVTGSSKGIYSVSAIPSSSTLRVGGRNVDGALPIIDEAGVEYEITRKDSGTYLRFLDGTFTAANPAPATLWAPLVLVDNYKYIEDNFGVMVALTKEDMDRFGTSQISYTSAVRGLMYSWASGPTFRSCETGAHILLDAAVSEELGEIVAIDSGFLPTRGRILIEDLTDEGEGTGIYRTYLYPNSTEFNLDKFKGLGINPETGNPFAVGDTVYPFTPLSNSVVISDNVSNPGWWGKYGNVSGKVELQKYHSWQVEIDLLTIESRDIKLVSDFLMKIRPIYTRPKIVGVLALQDTVYVLDDLYVDIDVFLYDDTAFSRESAHMVDSYNNSGASTRLLDYGSFSTRTLFRGDDLAVDSSDPTLITSERGGFVSGTTNDSGVQVLPKINSYFEEEVEILGQAFVRVGDVLYISTGKNRGRFLVSEVVSDTQLRISQYTDSAPRGIDPSTHMRTESGAHFHIQRYEDELIVSGSTISAAASNTITVSTAKFWSDGVTADDVLIISSGANRGVYHIEDLGIYDSGSEVFNNEETSLTLREGLPDTGDLSHSFEIRRRALLANPSYEATDGETTAGEAYITSAAGADLAYIKKGDLLTPSTGTDEGAVFRVIGVAGTTIHVDLPFSATETSIEFSVSHLDFEQDEDDSDYRFERLHPKDELEVTLYQPLTLLHSGNFTLSDNATVSNLICIATDEGATDLTALVPPVQAGDLFEVEIDSPDPLDPAGTTDSSSHGVYEISQVSSATVQVDRFFPGVQLTTSSTSVVPETGVACKIYTPEENFSVNLDVVTLLSSPLTSSGATISLEDMGVVPGDFFEDTYGTEHLIVEVLGSDLTLAASTGLTEVMSGRIFRRAATTQREFPDEIA